jgi:mercuric reductase
MDLLEVPASLIVVGGNYIGLEMGQLFARLGSQVTVVETMERIAPNEEPEISEALSGVLAEEGLSVRSGATVTRVRRQNAHIVATIEQAGASSDIEATHLLLATGRRPLTSELALANVGHPQFVYVAGAHGVIAVENAFDNAGRTVDYRTLPRVTFTTPNIAAVGMTDAEAQAAGLDCECRTISLDVVPRALVNRDTRGVVKIVADSRTGVVRGVHMLAQNAGDAILAGVYAIECGMTVKQVANIWCPYLTIAEGIKLAAQSFTMDVAKLSCCGA